MPSPPVSTDATHTLCAKRMRARVCESVVHGVYCLPAQESVGAAIEFSDSHTAPGHGSRRVYFPHDSTFRPFKVVGGRRAASRAACRAELQLYLWLNSLASSSKMIGSARIHVAFALCAGCARAGAPTGENSKDATYAARAPCGRAPHNIEAKVATRAGTFAPALSSTT